MSYDENDAAMDAFYEQVGNEAINDFTTERLRSYYYEHEVLMQPALRAFHEASRLLANGHPSAAIVFSAAATELFLKTTILQPLVYGMVHNDNLASVIVNYALGHTGFERYEKLLVNVFREIANLEIGVLKRAEAQQSLIEECKAVGRMRNSILHRGEVFHAEDAAICLEVAHGIYSLVVAPMLTALDLFTFTDGTISPSPYRTTKDRYGNRVLAEAVEITKGGVAVYGNLAGSTIPTPPDEARH